LTKKYRKKPQEIRVPKSLIFPPPTNRMPAMTQFQVWVLILLVAIGVGILGYKVFSEQQEKQQMKTQATATCRQTCEALGASGSTYQLCFNGCMQEAGQTAK
jgi:uncharacterized protein HemX